MPTPSRRSMTTRRNSLTDDEDAITPCSTPPPEPNQPAAFEEPQEITPNSTCTNSPNSHHSNKRPASPRFTTSRRGSASYHYHGHHHHTNAASSQRKASTSAEAAGADHFDPADGEPLSDAQLWRRMLAIQQEFHCYNSARMSAALLGLEMGVDVGQLAREFLPRPKLIEVPVD